jgi:hydrogenase expression/formation protein HypC
MEVWPSVSSLSRPLTVPGTPDRTEQLMCLGVPGKIEEIWEADGVRMAGVNFGGVYKDVCLAYLPDIQVGDYTIVHVGFALTKLDEASAMETLELMRSVGLLDEEFGLAPDQAPPSR